MADKTRVKIPFSQLEYTATFQSPMLQLVGRLHDAVVPFVQALEPWKFAFDETEFQLSSPKPRDHVITFQRPTTLPPPQMRVALRWSTLTVSVDQPDWTEAASIAKLCTIAQQTATRVGGAQLKSQEVSLAMHVQSETTPRSEITEVLLTPSARELLDGNLLGQGLIVHRENGMILIDNSAVFANGLFIRIQRKFDASVTLDRAGEVLLQDEEKLWNILGLEGEL